MEEYGAKEAERGTFRFNGRCPSQSGRKREEGKKGQCGSRPRRRSLRSQRIAHLGRFGRRACARGLSVEEEEEEERPTENARIK